MIEVYKILTGKYDPTLPSILHRNINSTTRGNQLKLCTYRPKYDLCKYNFTVRVISLWNSLPTHVITSVSVDSFKNRLDWTSFGLMRKHVSTTRLIYLAAVLQDASKSYVAFLLLCTRCGHRGLRPMHIVVRLCLCLYKVDVLSRHQQRLSDTGQG